MGERNGASWLGLRENQQKKKKRGEVSDEAWEKGEPEKKREERQRVMKIRERARVNNIFFNTLLQ